MTELEGLGGQFVAINMWYITHARTDTSNKNIELKFANNSIQMVKNTEMNKAKLLTNDGVIRTNPNE